MLHFLDRAGYGAGMKDRAAASMGRSRQLGRSRQIVADLSLLVLAVAILLVPSWIKSLSRTEPRFEERALRPFVVEVNSAPWYEWVLLDGIGEVRARRIVAHRKRHGPFRAIDDLLEVPGLPRGWLDRARRHLALEE